jgi:hypothetical protein
MTTARQAAIAGGVLGVVVVAVVGFLVMRGGDASPNTASPNITSSKTTSPNTKANAGAVASSSSQGKTTPVDGFKTAPEDPGTKSSPEAGNLFNRKDLEGWHFKNSDRSKWIVGRPALNSPDAAQLVADKASGLQDAALINPEGGTDIYSAVQHGDATIDLEFMVPKGADSGVYVLGEYEVQIFDSFGKQTLGLADLGGVFAPASGDRPADARPPPINVAKAPGTWQRMVIEFQAPKFQGNRKIANARFLKVAINGQVLHENVELSGPNIGGLTGNEAPTGPLLLQGAHASVAFRNIRITARRPADEPDSPLTDPPSGPGASAVYLDDLKEADFKARGDLGKHGQQGYDDRRAEFGGKPVYHLLSMHPRDDGPAYATYELKEGYRLLRATAALLDNPHLVRLPVAQAELRVYGDDKLLWRSPRLQQLGRGVPLAVNIQGVKVLKLEAFCTGGVAHVWTAWLNPIISTDDPKRAGPERGADDRIPAPPAADLEKAQRQLRESFPPDFAAASAKVKLTLARKLAEKAAEGGEPSAARYARLVEAREIAVQLADPKLAAEFHAQLCETFAVDRAALALEWLDRLANLNLPADKRKALLEIMLEATETAVADHQAGADQLDKAVELAELSFKTAGKFREQLRRATALRDRVNQFRTWATEAEQGRKTIAGKPGDAAVNTAVGLYRCFARAEWEQGLPLLAKSDNARLTAAARLELAQPATAAQQAAIADAWWEAGSAASGTPRTIFHERARHWYQQAAGGLTGAAKTTVEKRLATLEKLLGESSESGGVPPAKEAAGYYHLAVANADGAKRDGAKTSAVIGLTSEGYVLEDDLHVGRWLGAGSQLRIVFDDRARGAVRLRVRGKDTLSGQQTRGSGSVPWELTRLDSRLLGQWTMTYTNGAVRHYEFRGDGSVLFTEERLTARLVKDGEYYLVDFGDGKLDRLKLGGTLQVEHYNPRTALAARQAPTETGRGVRESMP